MALPIAAILGGAALGFIVRELLQKNGAPETPENVQNAQAILQQEPEIALNTKTGWSLSQLDRMPSDSEISMIAAGESQGEPGVGSEFERFVNKTGDVGTGNEPGPTSSPLAQEVTNAPAQKPGDVPSNPNATAQTAAASGVNGVDNASNFDFDTLNIASLLGGAAAG